MRIHFIEKWDAFDNPRGGSPENTPTRAELGLDKEPTDEDDEVRQVLMEGALNARE